MEKTEPFAKAIWESGFFGIQHIVCRPTAASWKHTIQRLMQVWGITSER